MEDIEKLLAYGRMDLEAGYPQYAREYFETVLALDASNEQAREALAEVEAILARQVSLEPIQAEVESANEEMQISHEEVKVLPKEAQEERIKVALRERRWLVGIGAAIVVIILLWVHAAEIVIRAIRGVLIAAIGLVVIGFIGVTGWFFLEFAKRLNERAWEQTQKRVEEQSRKRARAHSWKETTVARPNTKSRAESFITGPLPPRTRTALIRSLQDILRYGSDQEDQERYLAQIARLDQLSAMTPREFEEFVARMFRAMGHSVTLTQASGDKGVDIFLDSRKAIVQCKKYEGSVGQSIVRDFYGTMIHYKAERGYIVTTGTFSLPAQTWAKGKPIHLVDGMELVKTLETIKSERADGTQAAISE